MKRTTKGRIIVVSFLFLGFSSLIIRCVKSAISTNHSFDSIYLYKGKFDKEDSLLFKAKELKNMKITEVIKSNYRNEIRSFEYRNKYIITFVKIDLNKDIPLKQLIKYRDEYSSETTMHLYHVMSSNAYDFSIKAEEINKVDNIIFSLYGNTKDMQTDIYNKNFISYYLLIKDLSIRYGEDVPVDIFFGGKETLLAIRKKYPLMISFYKIHKSLYILFLIPNENELNKERNLFAKIMNDNSDLQFN